MNLINLEQLSHDPRYRVPWLESGFAQEVEQLPQLKAQLGRAVVDRAFLIDDGWLIVFGWLEQPGPPVLTVLGVSGRWFADELSPPALRRPDVAAALGVSSLEDSGVMLPLKLPDGERYERIWLNGMEVTVKPIDLRGGCYLQQLDDLLVACNVGTTPLDRLPELLRCGLAEALLHLREPLRRAEAWQGLVKQQHRYGPTTSNPELTVVVPLYGRWDFVKGQLAGWALDPAFTDGRLSVLYVVDDPTIEHDFLTWCDYHLTEDMIPVSVVVLRRNTGFAMACNCGVYAAATPQICLLNSDVLPLQPGWLEPLRDQLAKHPGSLVAPLLLLDHGLIQHAGMEARLEGALHLPVNRHPLKGLHPQQLRERHPDLAPFSVQALSGAALMFDRSRFLALGGFDPVFGRGDFEDLELSMRWRREGDTLWMVPLSQLIHLERQSISREPDPLAQWRGVCNAAIASYLCPEVR